MKVLGAIIAGGLSTRFGSDKAMVVIEGRTMLDRAIEGLRQQVEATVICGRECPGMEAIVDRPAGRIGPLGGLNAALHHAAKSDFDAVLCIPVDVWPLPDDMRERLVGADPAVFDQQHLIGFWPARLASMLDQHIACGERSVRSWIIASRARVVRQPGGLWNLNERCDLRCALGGERPQRA